MTNFYKREFPEYLHQRPRWSLDRVLNFERKEIYFHHATGLNFLFAGELKMPAEPLPEPVVTERCFALLQALRAEDLVATKGDGDTACDLYHLLYLGPVDLAPALPALPPLLDRSLGGEPPAGLALRIAIEFFCFNSSFPRVPIVKIQPLPEAGSAVTADLTADEFKLLPRAIAAGQRYIGGQVSEPRGGRFP